MVLSFMALLGVAGTTRAASLQEVQGVLVKIMADANIQLAVQLQVDPVRAGGAAYVHGHPGGAAIFIDPDFMTRKSPNDWAFILGHELSHVLFNLPGVNAANEWEADRRGAQIAIQAGFDPQAYINGLLADPQSCSMSHGCLHERAVSLAKFLNVQPNQPVHTQHFAAGDEAMPMQRGFPKHPQSVFLDCARPAMACNHPGPMCVDQMVITQITPCQHPIHHPNGMIGRQHRFDWHAMVVPLHIGCRQAHLHAIQTRQNQMSNAPANP